MNKKILTTLMLVTLSFNTLGVFAAECENCKTGTDRIPVQGFAVYSGTDNFHPYNFTRREVGDDDVLIEIMYSGICHSDIHQVKGDFQPTYYPLVPGHEIVGRIVKVGKNVKRFKAGDYAGVGCMVDSCGKCHYCLMDKEEFCEKGAAFTYSSKDQYHGNEITQGGYSNRIVVDEKFAIKVPKGADIKKVAPLLCAGVTTYSPIKFSHVKKGDKVAVAGFGGLGHMAVQYMVKLGADVTVFDITNDKRDAAFKLGAKKYVNINNPEELKGLDNSLDFIISTVPFDYDPEMYIKMLKMGGEMAIVGLPKNTSININFFVFNANRKVYGSLIGGIKETQEMLDYSVKNNIYPEVEVIPAKAEAIDKAYKSVEKGEVKFRYVIDMSTINNADFDEK